MDPTITVAVIGLAGVVLTSLIAGIFALIQQAKRDSKEKAIRAKEDQREKEEQINARVLEREKQLDERDAALWDKWRVIQEENEEEIRLVKEQNRKLTRMVIKLRQENRQTAEAMDFLKRSLDEERRAGAALAIEFKELQEENKMLRKKLGES